MPHAQARVAALLDIAHSAPQTSRSKTRQPPFRSGEVVAWVHWTEDIVRRHSSIKRGDEPREAVLSNEAVELGIQGSIV